MPGAPFPQNEPQRLKALAAYGILDTPEEEDYNDLVRLASQLCQTPISLIVLLDEHRQWFKASVGAGDIRETPREYAFCAHTILAPQALVVPDTQQDSRFNDNPLVNLDPKIRFYAGMPLETQEGHKLGTLCVLDLVPRTLSSEQLFALKVLARQAMQLIELRKRNEELAASLQTISQAHTKLNELDALRNRFLSILSHDIKSPLSSLQSLLGLWEKGNITREEIETFFSRIHGALKETRSLLDNILEWALSQSEGWQLQPRQIDLFALTENIRHYFALTSKERGIQIDNQLANPFMVCADEQIVNFVLRNLMANAIKFTPESGKITLTAQTEARIIRISVADTGVGIGPDELSRLFDWKYRNSTQGLTGEKGAGVGLIICREFAMKHGGDLSIESEKGKGTTAQLILPVW
jgi:signal transduction histidine kinase